MPIVVTMSLSPYQPAVTLNSDEVINVHAASNFGIGGFGGTEQCYTNKSLLKCLRFMLHARMSTICPYYVRYCVCPIIEVIRGRVTMCKLAF